jgi:hypothetical protein
MLIASGVPVTEASRFAALWVKVATEAPVAVGMLLIFPKAVALICVVLPPGP